MDTFIQNTTKIDLYLFAVIGALCVILIVSLYNMYKINKMTYKYNRFIRGFTNANIEDSLERFISRVEEVYQKGLEVENHCNEIDRNLLKCFQKLGVVRYNAFDDIGSDLSFAIALLDANDNGFVVNGIYSRESSVTYAKPIEKGSSKYTLSAEELQAIDVARKPGKKESKEMI